MITQQENEKLWDMIKNIRLCMMTTLDDGTLRARPMSHLQHEFSGKIWFFTDKTSGKIYEVEENKNICLSYADIKNEKYVSLSGTAAIKQDKAIIEKLWTPFAAAWFSGKDDPNLTLLEITIQQAEYWDATSSKMVQLFQIAKANLTGEKPDMGENRKFS